MGKPNFANDIETLANRSKRLRALIVDQKVQDGTPGEEQDEASHMATVSDVINSGSETSLIVSRIVRSGENMAKLEGKVQQVIESDNPGRLKRKKYIWSRRLTYLSTRIPEDMRNLIEDLVFILKKEARNELRDEPSLQDLACEAWSDLLSKYNDRWPEK
jgi:hypothetical protein